MNSLDKKDQALQPFKYSQQNRHSIVRNIQSLIQTIKNNQNKVQKFIFELNHHDTTPHLTINTSLYYVVRSLTQKEVKTLSQECECHCNDWSTIFLMYKDDIGNIRSRYDHSQDLSVQLKDQVTRCSFDGHVVLGLSFEAQKQGVIEKVQSTVFDNIKPAIKNNTFIKDTIIAPGARVYNNTMISNSYVGPNASMFDCGSIHFEHTSEKDLFNDDMEIILGPESGGGRPVNVTPESTLVSICRDLGISQSTVGNTDKSVPCNINFNIVLGELLFTHDAKNIYISQSAVVQSCNFISSSILLPQASVRNSTVKSTFMQWKSSINDSNVSSTLLMECAEIGPNSLVASTVLGPDSHVSCGEVHCSLIGPNTNSHHQSLVISVLWPMGRGNVGYGSNIGSNHTGRLPDQECTVGEGVFWGLGSIIKFPVDLVNSYYSVVAAGVQLPPQSVTMPFSLIMNSNHANGKNEIVPGWLLQSSPYTILRSEEKFRKRRKAKRHDFYCGWHIIRPSVIDACIRARESLLNVAHSESNIGQETTDNTDKLYFNSSLAGLGENYMTERGKRVGIESYTSTIRRYALKGLYEKLKTILKNSEEGISCIFHRNNGLRKEWKSTEEPIIDSNKSWPIMPWEEGTHDDSDKLLDHQLFILNIEFKSIIKNNNTSKALVILLKEIISLENNFLKRVTKSKMRDDKRGEAIIPGYKDAHVSVDDDPVVKMANEKTREIVSECSHMITKLDSSNVYSRL